MSEKEKYVCPASGSLFLYNGLRRLIQNPEKMFARHLKNGMTAMDIGAGPGFFSVPMAGMVGPKGKVIAVDLQAEMLEKLKINAQKQGVENIVLHQCSPTELGVTEKADFILTFWMVHEVPDAAHLLAQIRDILKPDGLYFFSEPKFHVSKKAFDETLEMCREAGFTVIEAPEIWLSRSAVMKR